MIKLSNINKHYSTGSHDLPVLKNINLEIGSGELVSIMGSSGSGKSTLLNILGILDEYNSGEYTLDGTLIKNLSEPKAAKYRNEYIGFIFQSFHLLGYKNAMENVALPLYYKGVSRKERNKLAIEYLDKVGLKDWAEHMPSQLSGGQQQRVAIARALAMDPKIMLFDEVTSALDPELVDEVLQVLHKLASNSDTTMLTVTHEMNFARDFADRVLFFDNGQIVESGKPADIFSNPKEDRTRSFLKKFISNIN